jgi:hypothetical protein
MIADGIKVLIVESEIFMSILHVSTVVVHGSSESKLHGQIRNSLKYSHESLLMGSLLVHIGVLEEILD